MTEAADVAVDDPDGIDSTCHAPPIDAEGPTDARCGDDAVTFVFRPAGHRVYLCRAHAELMNRFGDDMFADGHPTAVDCKRCHKPTPKSRINFDKICEECQVDS